MGNRWLITVLRIITCFVMLGSPLVSAHGQETGARVTILDQEGKPITKLTDGDTIRLKLESANKVTGETSIRFRLSGLDVTVAECTIKAGGTGCESKPFDSLGWFWNRGGQPQPVRVVQAWADASVLATSGEVQVASRPVVMVHGFSSSWEAWSHYLGPAGFLAADGLRGFAVGDGQAPGVMNTGNISNPTGRTNTIAENAAILGQYIAAVKKQTGAQKIDLLVHSLGGLIGRYYIDRLEPPGEVVNLIMLGSPMLGTGCANLPAALGFYLPAVLEFQSSYVEEIFNPQITHRRGVAFSALAGVPLVNPLQSPCTPVPSDLAVSRDSVAGIPMQVSEMPVLHTELNTSAEVYQQFVLPHLQTLPGDFTAVADPVTPVPGEQPMHLTRLFTGHINPGETNDLAINIEPNIAVASFALYDSSKSLAVQVTGASGKIINLDPVKNGLIEVKDPASLVYLGYGFNNPKPGAWLVKLSPTEQTPATGADYALTAVFQGGATLSAHASAMTPTLNEPVELRADLGLDGQALAISQAQAVIRAADGSVQTIQMDPVSDSKEVRVSWKPAQPGLYGIQFSATGQSADGFAIERTAFLAVEVQPGSQRTLLGVLGLIGTLALLALVLVSLFMRSRRNKLSVQQKEAG